MYSKHENVIAPEPQSKNETDSKETHPKNIDLDDIEFTDHMIENIEIMNEPEKMLSETVTVKDDCTKETSLNQLDDAFSSFETNDINEEVLDDDEYYELATSSIDTKSNTARLECHVCEKTFKYRIEHNKHMKIHEDISNNVEMTNEAKENDIHKALNEISEDSKRIHNCEKPHECKTCKRRFKQSANLKKHERIHTCEKPFECKTCSKTFSQASHLKTHERIHRSEKPFECKTCNKTFLQLSNLKRHEKIHTI